MSKLFGSEKEYKSLGYIHDNIINLGKNERVYLTSVLDDFNLACRQITLQKLDDCILKYCVYAVKSIFLEKMDILEKNPKYDKLIISHTRNFIITKLRRLTTI